MMKRWQAHDYSIQRRKEEIRAEQGDAAAEKWADQQYAEANGIQIGGAVGVVTGAAIGSIVPIVGTTVGAMVGGAIGALKGYRMATKHEKTK